MQWDLPKNTPKYVSSTKRFDDLRELTEFGRSPAYDNMILKIESHLGDVVIDPTTP